MKKILILLMASLMSMLYVNAQMPLMNAVTEKVNTLKHSGVDTIVTYHPYCVGCILTGISDSETCIHNIRQYVIWKKNGQSFVQLFDECYNYLPEKGAKSFVTLFTKNFPAIVKEELKPVEFEQVVNGKVQHFVSWIDHSYHQDFVFYINGKIINKPIDNYVLDTRWEGDYLKSVDDKRNIPPSGKAINLNYATNQKTYLKKLKDLAEQEIEKIKFTKSP